MNLVLVNSFHILVCGSTEQLNYAVYWLISNGLVLCAPSFALIDFSLLLSECLGSKSGFGQLQQTSLILSMSFKKMIVKNMHHGVVKLSRGTNEVGQVILIAHTQCTAIFLGLNRGQEVCIMKQSLSRGGAQCPWYTIVPAWVCYTRVPAGMSELYQSLHA